MNKSYQTLILGVFLSIAVMASGIALIHYDIQSYTLSRLQQQHNTNQFYIDEFKNTQTQIIQTLAHNRAIITYSSHKNNQAEELFYNFLLADNHIMQIRLINLNGDEQIRFDRLKNGTIEKTVKNELQNKANRPYLKTFIALSKNSVGFSEFDLNIEHGKIDIPFNPTIRIGTPIYDNNIKKGVIVINYYMDEWISHLQKSATAEFFLIDQEGYFLLHPNKDYAWSRYHAPSKKAYEYFKLSPSHFIPLKSGEYRWVDSNMAAFGLDFFGNKLLALYQPKLTTDELLLRRLFEFGFIIFLSLMLIIVPLVHIIRLNLRHIKEEKLKNEILLIHQSKLDTMGDMLGSLAHQWRQPLNSIGLIMQDLVSAFHYNELNKEYLMNSEEKIMTQLQFMSQTIDTFRNFFSHEKKEERCNLAHIVEEIHHLYHTQLDTHGINMEIIYNLSQSSHPSDSNDKLYSLISYPSEIKQILLNLLSNAKDALILTKHSKKIITFTLIASTESLSIEITDQAGGIEPQIADRIFEPYFTTKELGTGLGLYIAKILTEQHLKGSLTFKTNFNEGWSMFTLTIPRHLSYPEISSR